MIRVGKTDVGESTRRRYHVSITEIPSTDVNATIKFFSSITKTSQVISVNIKGETNIQCLHKPLSPSTSQTASFSVKRMLSYVIGDSGALVVAYTIMIATIILILILYHFYVKGKQTPVVIHSPYIHQSPAPISHSPPPYQYASPYHSPPPASMTPGSYGPNKQTPTRLFSVSQ